MPPGDADRIRKYLCDQVEIAREAGQPSVTFRAGDVHDALVLKGSHHNVCTVMQSKKFLLQAAVETDKYIQRTPSGAGSNLVIEYKILAGAGDTHEDSQDLRRDNPMEVDANSEVSGDSGPDDLKPAAGVAETTDVRQQLKKRLLKLTPVQFERLLGEYFTAKGCSEVEVTGRSNDGGIDGIAKIQYLKLRIAIQAKRYKPGNNIGIDPVQRLNGSLGNSYDRGVFVTTSSFTSAASGWVQEEQPPISLIDGDALAEDMIELGLGVREIPVVEMQVDEEFFGMFDN